MHKDSNKYLLPVIASDTDTEDKIATKHRTLAEKVCDCVTKYTDKAKKLKYRMSVAYLSWVNDP